jgi:hypothetical protein
MMETPGRNGKNISSTLGDDDRVQAVVGGPLIVTSRGTPRTPIEGTSDAWQAMTLVMQASLDPLMHTSTLDGPEGISPSVIETPPAETYTHVSEHCYCSNIHIYFPLWLDARMWVSIVKLNMWWLMLQGEFVPDVFVLKYDMRFDDLDEAYEFYCDYAKLAGFDVRKGRKRTQVMVYVQQGRFLGKQKCW